MKRLVLALLVGCSACTTSGPQSARELNPAELARVVPGTTRATEVQALLGAPSRILPWTIGPGESWAYPYRADYEQRVFWVEVSREGVVQATSDAIDLDSRPYRF